MSKLKLIVRPALISKTHASAKRGRPPSCDPLFMAMSAILWRGISIDERGEIKFGRLPAGRRARDEGLPPREKMIMEIAGVYCKSPSTVESQLMDNERSMYSRALAIVRALLELGLRPEDIEDALIEHQPGNPKRREFFLAPDGIEFVVPPLIKRARHQQGEEKLVA